MSTEFVRFLTDDGDELYLREAAIHGAQYSPRDPVDDGSEAVITVWETLPDGTLNDHDFAGQAAEKVRQYFTEETIGTDGLTQSNRTYLSGLPPLPLRPSIRAALIQLLQGWPGHSGINWETTIDSDLVALLLDVLPPDVHETIPRKGRE